MYKPPRLLLSKVKSAAPSYSIERGGFDAEDYYKAYESVIIYVQQGLSEYAELFKEVVKIVLKTQSDVGRIYPLLVLAFGNHSELIHDKKSFSLGYSYSYDTSYLTKIVEVLIRLSSEQEANPAIIPQLFPKTDLRSLYEGKTKVKTNDLLVIIGKKSQVFFNEELEGKLKLKMIKRTLFVEVEGNTATWSFGKITPQFKKT